MFLVNNAYFSKVKGYCFAMIAAGLYGASIPAAKYLLNDLNPWLLAGLLYLGSAFGLTFILFLRKFILNTKIILHFTPGAWKWMIISVILGGVIAPVLAFSGLNKISATTASLLLNFESVFTIILAWIIFNENTDKRAMFGIFLIILGSLQLAWVNEFGFDPLLGLTLITGAAFCWALENNLIKKIATEDPVVLALIKSFVAAITNIGLGIMVGGTFLFEARIFIGAGLVGIFCYGISMLLFILALRYIGAAQTGAYSSLTPFIGASLSVLFLGETISIQLVIAGLLMGSGVLLHLFKSLENP